MKRLKEIFLYANWKNIFFALLGSAILAFGTNYIYANSHIPEGGIIGVCLIIEHFSGIHPSISNIVITFFCYILAWRLMGTKYILNASIATIGFSVFYAIFSSPALDSLVPSMAEYPLLAALIGAIFVEVGTGIAHRSGSAPSGEQALTMAIVKRGGLNFGWILFIRDFTILSLSIVMYDDKIQGLYSVIYAILIMTLTTPITEHIVNAPKKAKFAKRIQKTRKSWISIIAVGIVLTIILALVGMYFSDYYHATNDAVNYTVEGVEEKELANDVVAYLPDGGAKVGFIFYPGGKVEYAAYAPLLKECASQGIACVVIEMPFNLAIFGMNRGVDVPELLPEVETWYIGGHSLGGSMAASCANTHEGMFEGVVLLASYSTVDITDLRVLSVYGSNDKVCTYQDREKYRENLPDSFSDKLFTKEIIGGNHAYFGMYGKQDGDGEATIENIDQIKQTAKAIAEFIIQK